MIARMHKSMQEKDKGFTLIELLVVIIIIGILAAIAIPVFLNQRKKGWDAAIKSDLKNMATAEETVLTDTGAYTATVGAVGTTGTLADAGFKYSAASNYSASPATITIKTYNTAGVAQAAATPGNGSYCLLATSASTQVWVYNSAAGGLQPNTVTTCP